MTKFLVGVVTIILLVLTIYTPYKLWTSIKKATREDIVFVLGAVLVLLFLVFFIYSVGNAVVITLGGG